MKLFLQKNAKFLSAGGSAPRPPCLRRLGASPPNPQPSAAGGFAPRPPLASGGWGLRPQTPQTAPPFANFWLRACLYYVNFEAKINKLELELKISSTASKRVLEASE